MFPKCGTSSSPFDVAVLSCYPEPKHTNIQYRNLSAQSCKSTYERPLLNRQHKKPWNFELRRILNSFRPYRPYLFHRDSLARYWLVFFTSFQKSECKIPTKKLGPKFLPRTHTILVESCLISLQHHPISYLESKKRAVDPQNWFMHPSILWALQFWYCRLVWTIQVHQSIHAATDILGERIPKIHRSLAV